MEEVVGNDIQLDASLLNLFRDLTHDAVDVIQDMFKGRILAHRGKYSIDECML